MINISGNELVPFKFQEKVLKKIYDKSAIVSMPTNSGKTLIAYLWANLFNKMNDKIIFTAPIKALSNERYMELHNQGFDVGIVTGDVKWNTNAQILCMTQEIYYQGYYKNISNVIIDEFHYIFNNNERARCYIESIDKTNPKSKLLLMSGTFKEPNNIAKFLKDSTNKKFTVVESKDRLVPLTFNLNGINMKDIKDSLIIVFSRQSMNSILFGLTKIRSKINKRKITEINELAYNNKIQYNYAWNYGVGVYHGKMLPKEKLFIEYLYRHGYLDTLIGTDALSLGLNLPAKMVIFGEIEKPLNMLQQSEFLQLAGRAGRYGLYDIGIVSWLKDSPCVYYKDEFKKLFGKYANCNTLEDIFICVDPDIKAILNGKHIEEEAYDMQKYSYPVKNINKYRTILTNVITDIDNILTKYKSTNSIYYSLFRDMLITNYLPEWDLDYNCYITSYIIDYISQYRNLDFAKMIDDVFNDYDKSEGEYLQDLLLLYKWQRRFLDNNFNIFSINDNSIYNVINELDHTIFNPDSIIIA